MCLATCTRFRLFNNSGSVSPFVGAIREFGCIHFLFLQAERIWTPEDEAQRPAGETTQGLRLVNGSR